MASKGLTWNDRHPHHRRLTPHHVIGRLPNMPTIIDANGKRHSAHGVTVEQYVAMKSKRNKQGCLLWYGKLNKQGYPELTVTQHRKTGFWLVYHYTYWLATGRTVTWPYMTLDHLCEVRRCIEPTHLEEVTMRENLMRSDTIPARNAAKTHCPNGHKYDNVNSEGDRGCKRCLADNAKRYRDRKKAR